MSQPVVEPQKKTSRKVKALLAGGLVLGVGAAVTLAAWTNQEWAEGIFNTGSFNIQSSADGENFDDHESEGDAAPLSFNLTGADNMAPNDTVAAPFVLQLDGTTTYDAEVALTQANTDDTHANFANLTYGIVEVDNVDACVAGATGPTIVPAGTALNATDNAIVFQLKSGIAEATGAPVTLCFQVAADNGLTEAPSTTVTWEFVGESQG